MSRRLIFNVFKYNPLDKTDRPKLKRYELDETDGMTMFVALNYIRDRLDHTLQFDFVCRAGICGSCAMVINGIPKLGCKTLTSDYKDGEITLLPLPVFELIGDLSINTAKWMNDMSKDVASWIHTNEQTIIDNIEKPMEPEVADEVFELDRCIECGCCIAACGTKRMRPKFKGAVALNRVARFLVDPRDDRTQADMFEIVGDDEGIFGCMSLLGCDDACPKDLPLQSKLAYLRRKMVSIK
ncbi:MAG: succinate dehydrogenase/fumarate reductase iron-sulfur subunit [Campylobacteraceae bacterium 4484_166]|nr:MAG: succinate dehydrogenase/fumarate reductase iron-sulfur subunit [Campylobacteraceae bacterium 4484_166]